MNDEREKLINELAEHLMGTCQSLAEGCETFEIDEDDLTSEDYQIIDNITQVCNDCGWWCEVADLTVYEDEQMCYDCKGERVE